MLLASEGRDDSSFITVTLCDQQQTAPLACLVAVRVGPEVRHPRAQTALSHSICLRFNFLICKVILIEFSCGQEDGKDWSAKRGSWHNFSSQITLLLLTAMPSVAYYTLRS